MTTPETTWDGQPIATDWPRGVSVMVFRRVGGAVEVLLLHRAHHGPDYVGDWAWTPPAGCRLPGEDVDECADRELHEEAGLSLTRRRIDTGEEWARYVAEAPADAVVTLHDPEHDRYEWVPPAEALRRVRPEPPLTALQAALATVRGDPRP